MTAKSMSARSAARRRHHTTPKESFLGRLLDPIDRLSETIFSILILLTFTLAFRIIKLGPDPTQTIYPSYMNDLLLTAVAAMMVLIAIPLGG